MALTASCEQKTPQSCSVLGLHMMQTLSVPTAICIWYHTQGSKHTFEYRFCDSLPTVRSSDFWLTTASRWLTKQLQSAALALESATSRNMDRWFGGCD